MRKLFGTDGIRGIANEHPMTVELATSLGRAVASLFRKPSHRPRIVIGKDTRLSGYMFETAMAAGICSGGADVLLVGPLPTPGIAFITHSVRADAGVVISASHNPFQDNGIKIFSRDGFKLPDAMEEELETLIESGDLGKRHLAKPGDVGRATRIDDATGRYLVYLKHTFPRNLTLDGITVVVDCANGAAYKVAPSVFEELGARVVRLGCRPNGENINRGCGALHPEMMQRATKRYGADLGIALDGDADRLILCDDKGNIVDGDQVLAICASRMAKARELNGNSVVGTVMSNIGLEIALREMGIELVRTQVGDRYVVEEMRRGGFSVGGEQSGHLVFLDHSTTGDGVLAALKLLSIMVAEDKPLSELTDVMERYPQSLVNVEVREKKPLEELPQVMTRIEEVEEALGADGRVLVRYSGTESKARVMVEGPDSDKVRVWAEQIADSLREALGV